MQKLKWNYPTTMWVGKNSIGELSIACKNLNISKPLLVTDNNFSKSNIIKDALSQLKKNNLLVQLFSNVVGNPTGTNVIDGVQMFNEYQCDGVIEVEQFGTKHSLNISVCAGIVIWKLTQFLK